MTIDIPHILSGHTPSGGRNPKGKKDIFWGMTATAIEKAVEEAYNTSEKLKTQGYSILVEGYSSTYKIIIDIWVNLKDKIIETAYPK